MYYAATQGTCRPPCYYCIPEPEPAGKMRKVAGVYILFLLWVAAPRALCAQEYLVRGQVRDDRSREALPDVRVEVVEPSGTSGSVRAVWSGTDGRFTLKTVRDSLIITLVCAGYVAREITVSVRDQGITDLGILYMRPEITWDDEAEVVLLSREQLDAPADAALSSPLLHARQDVFLNRASFDFSAGFFRLRGMDNREVSLRFNGVPLNAVYDGRPAWSSLGGLTDIARNRVSSAGRNYNPAGFGRTLGLTDIRAYPPHLRKGMRLTASSSNRSYRYRLMATYVSHPGKAGLSYMVSAGWTYGASGYVRGTPYHSHAVYACMNWTPNAQHAFRLGGVYANTRRGLSTALTPEAAGLMGTRYNPGWGLSGGVIRNARQRLESEPLIFFNHEFRARGTRWETAIGYQVQNQTRTRLSYFDAANPDPVYYRNLPSFYYNSPIGANYSNSNLARKAFVSNPQLNWDAVYAANRNPEHQGRARYAVTGDFRQGGRLYIGSRGTFRISRNLWAGAGLEYSDANLDFGRRLVDLLGAEYHVDSDPFSGTGNDLLGPEQKTEGMTAGYSYSLGARSIRGFAQFHAAVGRWEAWGGIQGGTTRYHREGLYQNGRYPQSSLGRGDNLDFKSLSVRAGAGYRFSGRHGMHGVFGLSRRPPFLSEAYVDPRENNRPFPSKATGKILGGALTYWMRYPRIKGRVTAYYSRFSDQRSARSYYAETAHGSAFFREITAGLAALHRGVETGLEYQLGPAVTATFASALGTFTYSGRPRLRMYYFPDPREPTNLPGAGVWDAGNARLDGLQISGGPTVAGSLGVRYRDPGYWWLDVRANYLGRQYESLALLRYVPDFRRDPEGVAAPLSEDDPVIQRIWEQRPLPGYYLLNISLGKSWLFEGHYIGAFVGINNAFDTRHLTGGYQQGRLATYADYLEDRQSGHPSFGSRYWYGYGRTYYLNVTWSF